MRRAQLDRFYSALGELEGKLGGRRQLGKAAGRDTWPQRGVYFVFEPDEYREDHRTPRVVRVGTHGLKAGGKSTLWGRLRQHRGTTRGDLAGGNHRGSVFRLHVGEALIAAGAVADAPQTWARRGSATPDVRNAERSVEAKVSEVIGRMSVLWLDIPDEPGPASLRGYVERNAIALLSNHHREAVDPPSPGWLGHHARATEIRSSGLWNVNHVAETARTDFVEAFEKSVSGSWASVGLAAEEQAPWQKM